MININRVSLIGRITRDPEIKETGNYSYVRFTIAVNRRFNSKNSGTDMDFIPCIAWNNSAVFLNNYAHKGDIVSVEGRIQTRSYENNGIRVYSTEVVAENIQLISKQQNDNVLSEKDKKPVPEKVPEYDEALKENYTIPNLDISADDLPFY